jgi:hypothetical protein
MGTRRRSIVIACLLVLIIPPIIMTGCGNRPDQPEFDNLFDPLGPDGGDPFQIEAVRKGNTVEVSWNRPRHPDIVAFVVTHSPDGSSFTPVSSDLVPGSEERETFIHETPIPNAINYYKVRAKNSTGQTSSVSRVVAASTQAGPYLEIAGGAATTPTRQVDLSISTWVGQWLEIADNPSFADPVRLAALAGDTTQIVPWDLGPVAGNTTRIFVYLRVENEAVYSLTAKDSILVSFEPTIRVAGNPATVADRVIDLEIAGTFGDSMRFASDQADLASIPYQAGDSLYAGYVLADNINPQTIYGEFLSDFGFSVVKTKQVRPDNLSVASFAIESLDGDPATTPSRTVRLINKAVALEMRCAENPSFIGVPWADYADTTTKELSESEGVKVLYAQYRNHWTDSSILSDAITLVTQALDVRFLAPPAGAVVHGGTPLQVRGLARPSSAAGAIDKVQVDLGDDNGFVPATGTTDWSRMWNVPLFETDTEVTLRARAIAGADTATTTVTVTVTQPRIEIKTPLTGAFVLGGVATAVTGTAASATSGAALDSVQVDAGGGWQAATGTVNWSFGWVVPEVGNDTPAVIHARAFAGTDIVTDSVSVIITQPSIAITSPLAGTVLIGGTPSTVSGVAAQATNGAALDSVKVHLGDGWQAASSGDGFETWTLDWAVPIVSEPTSRTLKARVWAGVATATDSVSVEIQ